jgi:ribosomal protein S18 acetylase RimI-like enzyme
MIELVKPKYEELSFRQELLADQETMSYNLKWGGIIDFPSTRWEQWYQKWVVYPNECFYRYLYSTDINAFVGECAYHFDDEHQCYICDVIVKKSFRGHGFGKAGLLLLLDEAKKAGISKMFDNIAVDNSAIHLFKQCGFKELWRNNETIMLEKHL